LKKAEFGDSIIIAITMSIIAGRIMQNGEARFGFLDGLGRCLVRAGKEGRREICRGMPALLLSDAGCAGSGSLLPGLQGLLLQANNTGRICGVKEKTCPRRKRPPSMRKKTGCASVLSGA